MLEIQVWSLGCENPLEKGMAIHSSIFAQRIPQSGMLQSTGVRHYWDTSSTFQLENFAIEAVFPGTIISSASYELEWYNIFRDRKSICFPNFQGFLGDILYTKNVHLSSSEGLSGSWSETFSERSEPWWWPIISGIPDSVLSTYVAWVSSIFKRWDRSFWLWGGGDRHTDRYIGANKPHMEASHPS